MTGAAKLKGSPDLEAVSGVSGEEMEWDIAGLYSCIGDIGDIIIIIINISLLLLVYLILLEWDYV